MMRMPIYSTAVTWLFGLLQALGGPSVSVLWWPNDTYYNGDVIITTTGPSVFDVWIAVSRLNVTTSGSLAIVTACEDVLVAELVAREARLLCLCMPGHDGDIRTTDDVIPCNVDRTINPNEYFIDDNTVLVHSAEDARQLRALEDTKVVVTDCAGPLPVRSLLDDYSYLALSIECPQNHTLKVMQSYYTNQTLAGSLANALVHGVALPRESLPANFNHVISVNQPHSCSFLRQGGAGHLAVSCSCFAGSLTASLSSPCEPPAHTGADPPKLPSVFTGFGGRTLVVAIIQYAPFVYAEQVDGEKVYKGYCIEMLNMLSQMLDFKYTIVRDTTGYGYINADGEWEGALRQLMDGHYDIVMADLTISSIRDTVVDFAYQFYEDRTVMLALTNQESSFYVFHPLHKYIWLCFVAAAGLVGFVAFLFERGTSPKVTKGSKFRSLWANLWYTYPAMVYQGGRQLPAGEAAKMVLIVFWIVVMVLVATYNANLTAFLSVSRKLLPYRTLDEVIKSEHLLTLSEYTFIRNTFQEATEGVFARAWQKILQQDPEETFYRGFRNVVNNVFTSHLPKVALGDWNSALNFALDTGQCNWGILDEKFLPSGFGLALPEDTPYKDYFDNAIFRLYESGIFVRLKEHYFGFLEESDCDPFIQTHSSTLGLDRLWPVFFVGGVGIAGAAAMLMVEKLYVKPQEFTLTDLRYDNDHARKYDKHYTYSASRSKPYENGVRS